MMDRISRLDLYMEVAPNTGGFSFLYFLPSQDHSLSNMDKIYTLIDPLYHEPRYVGYTSLSLTDRLNYHISSSKRHNKTHKDRWLRGLLKMGETPLIKVIKYIPKSSPYSWQYWETHFIGLYRKKGYKLTNLSDGGDGVTMTDEVKNKISRAMLGRSPSIITREKLRQASLGRKGKLNGQSKAIIVYNDEWEIPFESIKEATTYLRSIGVYATRSNITHCLKGDTTQGGKYIRSKSGNFNFKYSDGKD